MLLLVQVLSDAIRVFSNRLFLFTDIWNAPWLMQCVLVFSIVRQSLTKVSASMARAEKHLGPLIRERLAKEDEHGTADWPDKPASSIFGSMFRRECKLALQNDLVTWLLKEAGEHHKNLISDTVNRISLVNIAAIHTTVYCFEICIRQRF
jgi:hypothetical protein